MSATINASHHHASPSFDTAQRHFFEYFNRWEIMLWKKYALGVRDAGWSRWQY